MKTRKQSTDQQPLNASEVDMSTSSQPSTITLPSIQGVNMQNYDLQDVATDLQEADETRVPTGQLPTAETSSESGASRKNKRQAALKAKGGENPDTKPAKPAKPAPPPPFQVEQWDGAEYTECYLSDLMPLDETGLKSANVAMRDIIPENVANLRRSYREGASIPPLTVVWSNRQKFVPTDGNHRWEAQAKNLMEDLGLNPDDKASAKDPRFIEAMGQTLVSIEVVNSYKGHTLTNNDVIEMAFTANFTHGAPASTYGRTSYAIWWMERYVEEHGKPYHGIQQDACRVAGVDKTALSKALRRAKDKAEAKLKQPVDFTFLPAEDQDELDQSIEVTDLKQATDRLRQTCTGLIRVAKMFVDLFEDEESAHQYLAQFVQTAEDEEALSNLSGILSIGFDVPEADESSEEEGE